MAKPNCSFGLVTAAAAGSRSASSAKAMASPARTVRAARTEAGIQRHGLFLLDGIGIYHQTPGMSLDRTTLA